MNENMCSPIALGEFDRSGGPGMSDDEMMSFSTMSPMHSTDLGERGKPYSPVTNAAPSDTRKDTTFATSSG